MKIFTQPPPWFVVSIHAPVRGRTGQGVDRPPQPVGFNPRPREGANPRPIGLGEPLGMFQSAPP